MINTTSPCATCSSADSCIKYCDTWKSWFKTIWRGIRELFKRKTT